MRFGVRAYGASGSAISSSAGQWCDLGGVSGGVILLVLGCNEASAI